MKVRNVSVDHQYAKTRGWVGKDGAAPAPGPIDGSFTSETDTDLVLHPDGSGGVEWVAESASATAGMVPYYIPVSDTFTVPIYKQALFAEAIEVDGALVVNGLLIGVD